MLKIAVTTPKGQTSQIDCTIDQCTVGKSDENLIVLQGWAVAKKHAAIQRKPDGVYVEDLNSSSGTEINGSKISQHGPLKSGEKIAIANYTLEVLELEEAAPAAPPRAGTCYLPDTDSIARRCSPATAGCAARTAAPVDG